MRLKKVIFYSLAIGLMTISISGCGNRQGQIDSIQTSSIDVVTKSVNLPNIQREGAGERFPISLKNTGASEVEVVATLVNTPTRIHFLGEKAASLSCVGNPIDTTCGSSFTCIGSSCISYSDTTKKLIRLPKGDDPTSFLIGIIGGARDLKCPTAPADVPDEYKDYYCGQINLTFSNAGKKETKTVYLQYKGLQGVAKLSTQAIRFDNTIFGRKEEKTITLENAGENPLVVSDIAFKGHHSFTVKTNKGYNFTLSSGEKATITVSFLPKDPTVRLETDRLEISFTTSGPKNIEIQVIAPSATKSSLLGPIEETMLAFNDSREPLGFQLVNSNPLATKLRLHASVSSANGSGNSYQIAETSDGTYKNEVETLWINGGTSNNSASLFIKPLGSAPNQGTLLIQSDDRTHPTEEIILTNGTMQPYGRSYPHQLSLTKDNQSFRILVRNMGGKPLILNGYTCSQCKGGDTAITFDSTTPAPTASSTIEIPPFSYHLFKINIPSKDNIGSSSPKLIFTTIEDLSSDFPSDTNRLAAGVSFVNSTSAVNSRGTFTIEGPLAPLNMPKNDSFYIHANNTGENDTCEWYFSSSPTFSNSSTARPFLIRSQPCNEGLILNPQIPGDYLLFAIRVNTGTSAELPFTITETPTTP